jgi:cytochrome c biogenesis protein CcmG/thiol:disulfide interchange protein DsbE
MSINQNPVVAGSVQGTIPTNESGSAQGTIPTKRSRKRNITIFVVVCLLNVGLLVLLWTQLMTPRATHSPDDPSLVGEVASPLVGQVAPDFKLPVLGGNGANVRLADLKGKAVVLNFWGSWCEPCQKEAPLLQQTWTRIQSQEVVMLGIDIPESSDTEPLNFIHQYGITYTNVKDTVQGSTGLDYGTTGQPETFFIDRNGVVVSHWFGPLTEAGMRGELAKLQVTLK